MIVPSDLLVPLVTTVVLIALTGVLPISNAASESDGSAEMADVLKSRRYIAAVLVVMILIALVITSAEHYFDPAHRLNDALIDADFFQ